MYRPRKTKASRKYLLVEPEREYKFPVLKEYRNQGDPFRMKLEMDLKPHGLKTILGKVKDSFSGK